MSIKNTLNREKQKTKTRMVSVTKQRKKNGKNLVAYERKTTGIKKQ